jgi:hypothetical protein
MVRFIPHKNRFLAWLGCGSHVCDKHGDVSGNPFHYCFDCGVEDFQRERRREREARIEEMAEAIRRSGACR